MPSLVFSVATLFIIKLMKQHFTLCTRILSTLKEKRRQLFSTYKMSDFELN